MPGIDFDAVREQVSLEAVLELLHFRATRRRGCKLRGRCPLCGNTGRASFVADTSTKRYCCYSCHRKGNHLELWSAAAGLQFSAGVKDLCAHLGLCVPLIHRW